MFHRSNRCNQREEICPHCASDDSYIYTADVLALRSERVRALMVFVWPSTATEPSLKTYVNERTQHASGLVWAGQAVWLCGPPNVPKILFLCSLNDHLNMTAEKYMYKKQTGTKQMLVCLSNTLRASGEHCDFLKPNSALSEWHNASNAVAGSFSCGQVNWSRHCAPFQTPL